VSSFATRRYGSWETSHLGSVSVFEVGIGLSVFFRIFKVSLIQYSVSVFQNIARSIAVFGIFPRLRYFKSVCTV